MKPLLRWQWNRMTVKARTKSEARAVLKKLWRRRTGEIITRLPAGAVVTKEEKP